MRRNIRGGNRRGEANFQGPLMTDHLKDLDLELQLLKRKRQMIEQQQQQMMGTQEQRGYMYDRTQTYKQEPYNYDDQQDYNPTTNFSQLYNDPPNTSYSNKYGNQLGRKRQVESPWENGAAPKRFSGPKGKFSKKPFGDRSGKSMDHTSEPMGRRPQPSGSSIRSPQSLMSLKPKPPIGHRNRPSPSPMQQNFKPSKVTKARPAAAANKLKSYPVVERKRLVAEASNLVAAGDDDRVLTVDRVPTQQMTGRLELALGGILKDLKNTFSTVQPHVASFQAAHLQRVMKQFIRERIRSVMLGKVVGNVADIIFKYRKVFPTSTDVDILQAALDAQEVIDKKKFGIKLVEADNPEEYFSVNMQKLIDVTLNEMFSKLHEIYGNSGYEEIKDVSPDKAGNANDTSKDTPDVSDIQKVNDESTVHETTTENDTSQHDETTNKNDTSKHDENTTENDTSKHDENNTDNDTSKDDKTTVEKDTSKVDEATKENDGSNLDETTMENDVSKADEIIKDTDGSKNDDTAINNDDSTLSEAANVDNSDIAKPVDDTKSSYDSKFNKIMKQFKPNSPESKQCEQYVESAIKRRMPKILRKHIPLIIKLLNLDNMYRTATSAIIKKSAEKVGLHVKGKDVGIKGHANTSLVENEDGDESINVANEIEKEVKKTLLEPLRYFVKIIARPSLPKRKLMQAFLNDFNPKTIKKHKNMHSLLFVGFSNQEDFDKILAATGTIIGRTTLDIRVSEKANDKRKTVEEPEIIEVKDEATEEQSIADTSLDSLIGSDLDNKITDLLTSIRKAEEEEGDAENHVAVSQNEKTTEPDGQNDDKKGEPQKEISQNNEETVIKMEANESVHKDEVEQTNVINEELITIDESTEVGDRVETLKNDAKESGRATPTRSSSRLANVTPSTIKTRRASRLAQNNP